MKRYRRRFDKGAKYRTILAFAGIVINVLLSYISYPSGLTGIFDSVGTMLVAAVGGSFPGIVVAFVSNILCLTFNSNAIYFGIVNVIIAIYTAWFVREKSFRKISSCAVFVVTAGLLNGGLCSLIQWGALEKGQNGSANVLMDIFGGLTDASKPLINTVISIIINIVDKIVSLAVVLICIHFIPKNIQKKIRESGWKQRPLSVEKMKKLDSISGDSRFSLNRRMVFMLLTVTLTLTLLMGWTGVRLYFINAKQEKTEIATAAVEFAADVVDPDKIDDYIRYGRSVEGYNETEDMLYHIRENAAGVKYLYIIQIREDGCYYAFDLDTDDTPANTPGYRSEFEEAFLSQLPKLMAGEKIKPVESNSVSGWVLTVYNPIKDAEGNCKGYACADVSLEYMADYMSTFLIRVFIIMASLIILVLAYALWLTGVYIMYPINDMVETVEKFVSAGNNQEKLDDYVREIRAVDIHTGDEVEKLYNAICNMALNQTEQLRSLRHFSENTAKMQDGLIITMADLVENRDSDTGAHVQKTSAYVRIIAEGLRRKGYYPEKLTDKFMSDVVRSAPLHDIGKINIPDTVLNKPGKLTDEEYAVIKTHTTAGRKIMEKAISTVEGENYLKEARNMAAYHHERWDGKGYPEGLHGEVIPLAARIMAVADVFDALVSPRVYKPAFPLDKALEIIKEGAGTQFDPKCVEVFMESLPAVKEVLKNYSQFEPEHRS